MSKLSRNTKWFLIFLAALLVPVPAGGGQSAGGGSSENWSSFRGPGASGVLDGMDLPSQWDVSTGDGVLWKRDLPGLAHSSPVVWGDRIFLITAISSRAGASFKPGLYGDGDASDDRSIQEWKILSLDRHTGKTLWERTAYRKEPRSKRHIKSTYANATPATDGRFVVAMFGSEGLVAYDMEGNLKWQKDLGRLDMGAYNLPAYEWGPASSPIIYGDLAIVQCDTQQESFLLAVDLTSGETVWRTVREELPSWGTPTVFAGKRPELVTNGSNFIRGYDPLSGEELWRLGGSSKITAPTPVVTDDLIIVASGRHPERPIFAIRPGATGNITLTGGLASSDSVAWSKTGRGSYMPTPLAYRGQLYVLGNSGIFDAYRLEDGSELYRERIRHAGSGFSASPVASDGLIYLSSEDGEVFVVRAGPSFELVGRHPLGDAVMATPAMAGGVLYLRTEHHLFAVGRKPPQ